MQENKKNFLYIFFFSLIVLSGCHFKVDQQEYISWVRNPEHGLVKTKQIGDYKIRCQYKPFDFIVLSEKNGNEKVSPEKIIEKKQELEGMQYYDLYIGHSSGDLIKSQAESEGDYYNRMYYYSFGFANDIKLIEGTDTLACELYHFERDYDLAKEKRFLLGFESKKNSNEDKVLLIDSKVLGLAIVKIQIKNKDIKSIPEVEYETKN